MKKKKLAALLLAGAMGLGLLAGCSNGGKPENGGGDTVTIKVGGIGPTTGDNAQYGTATEWGAEIAVEEINALNGPVKLEFKYEDDTGAADTAVAAYNNLKDWAKDAPLVIYGTTTTGPCVAVSAETYADRIFQLTPSASSPDVVAGKDNVFQMCFTDPYLGTAGAEYLKDKGLGTKYAVIYNNGDAYSTGIAEAFIAKTKELGMELVATQTYPDDKTTDYTVQLNACKDAGADVVFLPIYYTPASLILAQAKQMSYAPLFIGGDGMDGMLDMDGFDKSLAEGLLLMTPFSAGAEDDRTKSFVEKFQKAHNILPNQFAADGYDCMYAIYEACLEIEGLAGMDSAALCDALSAKFGSGTFKVDGLTGKDMTWKKTGEIDKAPLIFKVENGAYVDAQ
ncbi:MAG: ABC transporter substrate-binding protein [Oscillospiraceae bacterium]|jgi:branched-chain amino acid transport system substrate-binding protein|nr:ABC transporter substrate-binding protein [Oscillospiraceae bacterium]